MSPVVVGGLQELVKNLEGDTGDIHKFVINLLPFDDFTQLISDLCQQFYDGSLLMREQPYASGYVG